MVQISFVVQGQRSKHALRCSPWVVRTWFLAVKKMAFWRLMVAPAQSSTVVPAPP